MDTRTWTDPSGRTWVVSIQPPPGVALATDGAVGDAATPYIRFTDPADPACHPSVRYTSTKSLSRLTDGEIASFWAQLLGNHPELRQHEGPTNST